MDVAPDSQFNREMMGLADGEHLKAVKERSRNLADPINEPLRVPWDGPTPFGDLDLGPCGDNQIQIPKTDGEPS